MLGKAFYTKEKMKSAGGRIKVYMSFYDHIMTTRNVSITAGKKQEYINLDKAVLKQFKKSVYLNTLVVYHSVVADTNFIGNKTLENREHVQ
jgi:hypothetical protein